jgi:hypothetical protein
VVVLALVTACAEKPAINGRYIDRFYTPNGIVDQPTDLSGVSFDLFIDGLHYAQTEGTFDGTIYIPDVPDGPFVVRTSGPNRLPTWEQRDAHEFTVVSTRVGRPDAVRATNAPLHLVLDGLAAWDPDSMIIADCFENGTEHYPIVFDMPLASGATSVDASFDWARADWGGYLLDSGAGDRLTISRYARTQREGLDIEKLSQIATGPAPSQQDGVPSEFVGTFGDVAPTQSFGVSLDLDAFAAAVPQADRYWGAALLKAPTSAAFDRFGPTLVGIDSTSSSAPGSGLLSITETYGDPYDASWQPLVISGYGVTEWKWLDDRTSYLARLYAYDERYYDGSEYTLAMQQPATSGTLNGYPLAGDIPWDGESPITLEIAVPPGLTGFSVWLDLADANRAIIVSNSDAITLPSEAVRLGAMYLLDVHVGTQSEASRSGVFSTIGPFRLVRAL